MQVIGAIEEAHRALVVLAGLIAAVGAFVFVAAVVIFADSLTREFFLRRRKRRGPRSEYVTVVRANRKIDE